MEPARGGRRITVGTFRHRSAMIVGGGPLRSAEECSRRIGWIMGGVSQRRRATDAGRPRWTRTTGRNCLPSGKRCNKKAMRSTTVRQSIQAVAIGGGGKRSKRSVHSSRFRHNDGVFFLSNGNCPGLPYITHTRAAKGCYHAKSWGRRLMHDARCTIRNNKFSLPRVQYTVL